MKKILVLVVCTLVCMNAFAGDNPFNPLKVSRIKTNGLHFTSAGEASIVIDASDKIPLFDILYPSGDGDPGLGRWINVVTQDSSGRELIIGCDENTKACSFTLRKNDWDGAGPVNAYGEEAVGFRLGRVRPVSMQVKSIFTKNWTSGAFVTFSGKRAKLLFDRLPRVPGGRHEFAMISPSSRVTLGCAAGSAGAICTVSLR